MATITEHEGKKYKRVIWQLPGMQPVTSPTGLVGVEVDPYCVGYAFGVHTGPHFHALKKVLMPGQRGKGTFVQDIDGAIAALHRLKEETVRLEGQGQTGLKEAVEKARSSFRDAIKSALGLPKAMSPEEPKKADNQPSPILDKMETYPRGRVGFTYVSHTHTVEEFEKELMYLLKEKYEKPPAPQKPAGLKVD